MKFTNAITTLLVATTSFLEADAAPSSLHSKRQNQGSTAIVGVQGQGVKPRLELRTMQSQNKDQFNLYLLALRRMMNVAQSDPLSYYQIAGIHGRPYIPWDNQISFAGPNGFGGGYCTHVSNVFLTWHRPYLALIEQTLFSHAQIIANSFPADRRQRYVNALNGFRIPYWDWAAPSPCSTCTVYPKLVSSSTISVDSPTGGTQTVANPLFRYDFQGSPGNDFVYDPFATWTYTRRWPTSSTMPGAANAASQDSRVTTSITNNRRSFADRVYNLMTNSHNFTEFSNEAWMGNSRNVDSLESLHDAIHAITGSGGHMTYLDYSAFDPVFWLHHTNIDRLWDMWSTINPNSYVEPGINRGATYTIPAGWSRDANSGLQPFSKDTNWNIFNSNDVRGTTRFGYTYPETSAGNVNTVNTAVSTLYGPNSPNSLRKRKRDLSSLSKRSDGHEYHYVANVVSQKFKLSGSYAVYIFLGTPPDNYEDLVTADNLVGTHSVLANMESKGMQGNYVPVSGTVPLTSSLHDMCDDGKLKDMEPSTVSPYLKANLNWRVAQYDGTIIPNDQVPDLSVSVVVSDVTPATSSSTLPTWGHFTNLEDATVDKIGGYIGKWWDATNKKWTTGEMISTGLMGTKKVKIY